MKTKMLKLSFIILSIWQIDVNATTSNKSQDNDEIIKIKDPNFEKALVLLKFDSNGINGNILKSDAKKITILRIDGPDYNLDQNTPIEKIKDLSGIEHFKNLTELSCKGHLIKSIDLSQNLKLQLLNLTGNQISSLDLTHNHALVTVNVDFNKISNLLIGTKLNLQELYGSNTIFESLDVSRCPKLNSLDLNNNKNLYEILYNSSVKEEFLDYWYRNKKAVLIPKNVVITKAEKRLYKKYSKKNLNRNTYYWKSNTQKLTKNNKPERIENTPQNENNDPLAIEKKVVNELENFLSQKIKELIKKHNISKEEIKIWTNNHSSKILIN